MTSPTSTPRRDLFGDVAVAKGLLTWAQVRDALKRQLKYKEMGIPIKIGEVAIEMRLLTLAQCNDVLAEQSTRRKASGSAAPKKLSESNSLEDIDDGEPFLLGRFRLEKRLGGVMGVVYRGIDTENNSEIALKALPKTLAFEPSFVERFKREVKATGSLAHPNIVRIFDAGVEHGVFYLAMEFIEGESLNQRLRREGPMSERDALKIGYYVSLALAHAHAKNVLHRDVKPENIMLAKDGRVKLTDFGLAKLLADEQQITAEGIAVGTPHYIAPEQARALKDTDHRADLYALGATMFHVLTGRLPYEGDDGAEIMRRHVFEATPDPRKVKSDMTPAVADILMKLMAKSPADRFQSAVDLCAALQPFIGDIPPPPPTPPSAPLPNLSSPQGATRVQAMPRKRFTE
jgi:serine/threonine protein kinase